MHDLEFQVGDMIESRSFQRGYRGAWFRCKIRGIRMKNAMMNYHLEYIDYPDEKPTWIKLYQKSLTNISKLKGFERELMVRPSFPTVYRESEKPDVSTISNVIVVVDNVWKVGDLVDWWTDGCYWSGKVTNILGNGQVKIDLLPPPSGEGTSDAALSKDLRPSLDWCPEKGWTVPMPILQEGGYGCPCARIIKPPNSGGILSIHSTLRGVEAGQPIVRTYSSHSSQNSEGLLDSLDGWVERRKQFNTARNGVENDVYDNKIGKTFSDSVSSSRSMDASIGNMERTTVDGGYNHKHPSKKRRINGSLGLNSMSSNTIEAAILDLEELVNKIRWLRGLLNFRIPLSGNEQPSWEFLQHHAPCK